VAGVLIEMRGAILRRSVSYHGASGSRGRLIGGLSLALFVTLLAGLVHYHYPGAGAAVVATLSFGWLLGWVTGPLLTGDDATLRMDYFKLLPIPARKMAFAMSRSPCSARRSAPGALIGVLVLAWPPLLARRLTMSGWSARARRSSPGPAPR
jgi:hypothetical protein